MPKETNIFFEVKSTFDQDKYISDLKKKSGEFAMAYGNLAYDKTEKKFRKEKREYFLLYNNNREKGVSIMNSSLKKKDSDKEVKVLYNSGYVQISSIVSLQNQIRAIIIKWIKWPKKKKKKRL